MISVTTGLQYGVGFAAVVLSGYFAAVVWDQRAKPTVRLLLLLAVVLASSSVAYLVTSYPPVEHALRPAVWPADAGPIWIGVLAVLVIVASGLWFLFALQYTGRGGPLVRPATATVGILWALVLVLVVFVDVSPPPEVEQTQVEFMLGFGAFFMNILLAIGVLLVLTTSLEQNAIGFREGLVLSGGAVTLGLSPIVLNSNQNPAIVPMTLLVASGLFILAIRRYPVFDAPPVIRIAGRDRLIQEMDDAVVITDLEGRIHDLNPAAERYFETDRTEAVGQSLETLLPAAVDPNELAETETPVELRTATETTLAVTTNRITDVRDRSFGYLLVCRDVTERRRRERRLGVLNQLLTGAVIDRMNDIAANAALLASSERDDAFDPQMPAESDPSRVGADIRTQTNTLVELVTRTREIERALAEESATEADTISVIRNVTEAVTEDDGIEIEIEAADSVPPAAIDATVLETIIETLLTDAVGGDRKRIAIEIADIEGHLEIHIVDGGSMEMESPVDVETDHTAAGGEGESSLRALSIEMTRLAATHVGGDVSVRSDRSTRRIVVEVPTIEAGSTNDIEPILADGNADEGLTEQRGDSG